MVRTIAEFREKSVVTIPNHTPLIPPQCGYLLNDYTVHVDAEP
jgi:hypothetical protein